MKPYVHKKLTEIAIKKCAHLLNLTKKNKLAIIQGSIDEDKTPKIERITNWHFFRGNNTRISKNTWLFFLKCKPTSEDIFSQRITELRDSAKGSSEYYNNLGRVIHHIQDMSTPSHVVPIYHAIIIKDYFESYMKKNIDKLELGTNLIFTNETISFKKLYTRSAKATLKYIKKTTFKAKKDNNTIDLPLNKFWLNHKQQEDKQYKGFGTYGNLHKFFKNSKKRVGYIKIDSELAKINTYICNKAIQDTCDALLYQCKKK